MLNSDLMEELVRRDELHTVQDSMLVDIEDLTGSVAAVAGFALVSFLPSFATTISGRGWGG